MKQKKIKLNKEQNWLLGFVIVLGLITMQVLTILVMLKILQVI